MMDLIAGPWVGEFGWELFAWQGVLRNMAEGYKRIIIYGRPGHEALYADFMDEYREFIPQGNEPNMWLNEGTTIEVPRHDKRALWIQPQQLAFMPNAPQQAFIRYGGEKQRNGVLVYHARYLDKYGSDYMNWGKDNWEKLLERYGPIICIGSKGGALYAGGEDMRGAPLFEVIDLLAEAETLVGPSSGPIHLGSLCGTPHVVWSGHIVNKGRYENWWNPLKTRVRTIMPEDSPWTEKKQWQPTPDEVAEEVAQLCAA
jgi:hypothetical protein